MREYLDRLQADRLAELVDTLEASPQDGDIDPSTGNGDSANPGPNTADMWSDSHPPNVVQSMGQ